jgi:methionine synthase II (cobalamin-independent)
MPKLTGPLEERYLQPVPGPKVVTLPSPYALSEGTGVSATAIAEGVLKPVVDSLDAELVVLAEPFFGREEASPDVLAVPLEKLAGGPKLALQLTFCNAREPLQNGLAELPIDAIGIDFYATHLADVPKGFGKLLLAGIVDARSSALEDPRELADFAERLRNDREVEQVALVPNGDLQFVSERIAREKLGRLGAAKTATVESAA